MEIGVLGGPFLGTLILLRKYCSPNRENHLRQQKVGGILWGCSGWEGPKVAGKQKAFLFRPVLLQNGDLALLVSRQSATPEPFSVLNYKINWKADPMGTIPNKTVPASSQMPANKSSSSFETLTNEELEAHLGVYRYGAFDLTDAVRPSYDLKIIPRQGFRHDAYVDPKSNVKIPVLMASASRERLFDLFVDLLNPLGENVDVVLETSHHGSSDGHEDLYREHIDMPVLQSILYDFEDMLLNDGCTGIAVLNPGKKQEIQFDEHKMLIIYGSPLECFEKILIEHDVYPDKEIQFITEAEHVHSSSDSYFRQFDQLAMRLGIDAL